MTINLFDVLLCLFVVCEGIRSARLLRECYESCDILSERNSLLSKRVCELETWLPGQIETVLDTAEDSGTSDAPSQT